MSSSAGIFELLCGCCLSQRRRRAATNDSSTSSNRAAEGDRGQAQDDERTPLLEGNHTMYNGGRSVYGQQKSQPESGGDPRQLDESARCKDNIPRGMDSTRLKQIRDQTRSAFFSIENSQLLPSSFSLHQSLQQAQITSPKREAGKQLPHDPNTKDVVAESDNTERLYKAALSSPNSSPSGENSFSPSKKAPVGLVRHLRLSVHDTSSKRNSSSEPISISGPASTSRASSKDLTIPTVVSHHGDSPNEQSSTPVKPSRHRRKSKSKGLKLPSQHSLRTLRLERFQNDESSDSNIRQKSSSGDEEEEEEEEEEWGRRGRTRSRQGLIWVDISTTSKGQAPQEGSNMSDVRPERREEDKFVQDPNAVKIENALRLEIQPKASTKRMVEDLRRATSNEGPIAQAWRDEL